MDKYSAALSDNVKRSSSFLRDNTRWVTLAVVILSIVITLIMAILNKYMKNGENYLLGATYYDIISVIICMFLFVNLCIGYGAGKM